MTSPKPVVFTQGANPTPGTDPQPFIVVGGSLALIDPQAAQADTVAADLAALKVDFNALLAKLRLAGVIAS